ncbi:hypothetical protein E2562_023225 [Oryza meyeriana var. granulata]|uniref:Uncharacterized protein n=1 Tax=Oryza meyeriana var. granulata TaxID=110450 RepID=A0A6G1C0R5_9ORYZ|nr:hypothetical protein E2562_023225 [Oryza meyeriana var. granulata]
MASPAVATRHLNPTVFGPDPCRRLLRRRVSSRSPSVVVSGGGLSPRSACSVLRDLIRFDRAPRAMKLLKEGSNTILGLLVMCSVLTGTADLSQHGEFTGVCDSRT